MIAGGDRGPIALVLLAEIERVLAAAGTTRRGSDVVLVACSGGVDSVVLAHATCELLGARRVVLGHVDHAVRPGSALDAAFVAGLALRLGAGHESERLPPGAASEDRLRTLRYEALARFARKVGARLVLTAHTEDDQAETVLLALLRSARLDALRAIPVRRGDILRPLLHVPRNVVRTYAESERLEWRDDPTNLEPAYLRNRVRKELLPLLERRYRRGMARRLAGLAEEVRTRVELARTALEETEGASPGTSGRWGEFPQPLPTVRQERSRLADHEVPPSVCVERRAWSPEDALPDGRTAAVFDADVLEAPVIRGLRPGDRVEPFGFAGHKKVTELLRAARVPERARAGYPVVARTDGTIVWVPGVARSSDALVQPLTRHVWVFWMEYRSAQLQDATRHVTLERPGPRPMKTTSGQDERPATKEPGQDDE